MTVAVTRTADHTVAVATLLSAADGSNNVILPTYLVTSTGTEIGTAASPAYVAPGTSTTWAISAASLPLPSGAATSAKQDTIIGHVDGIETSAASIDGKITACNTGAVIVASSALPSGAATAAKQPALGTAGTASSDVITVQGITSMTPLKVDGSGVTQPVSIASTVAVTDNSQSLTVDAPVGTPVYVRLSDGAAAITTLPVSLASVPSHAVTNAGTFAVQVDGTALTKLTDIETNTDSGAVVGNGAAATAQRVTLASDSTGIVALTTSTASIGKLASNTGVTIGAVEIAAAQTLATVTTVSTVTTCSTVTTLSGGGVAHDGVDSGNPVKVGAKAVSALSTATMVAAADRTDATSDLDGALVVRPQFPLGDLLSERVTDTGGTSTAFTNFGATASTRNYITAISVYNSSATAGYIDFRDGTGGSVLFTVALPAGGGAVLGGDLPLFRTSANTALAYDVSGALSTVYISVSGFKSKV